MPKSRDLPGEDFVVAVIVADRAHQAAALREIERRIGPPIRHEAATELCRKIGAVRCATAVAADQQFPSRAEAFRHRVNCPGNRLGKLLQRLKGVTGSADRFLQKIRNVGHGFSSSFG